MILLFTSDNCTWCDVLKGMLAEEWSELNLLSTVHEINVNEHSQIAEVYGVLIVPTLVAGPHKITGVPTSDDLRSFIITAMSNGGHSNPKRVTKSVFTQVRTIQREDKVEAASPELLS
ncbi:hypothetical protein EU546_04805 [Candidatus Thorarchaeota archaeon]|nr:MAG: hypothetical protein EU546_04805 [Candidatus Thorarchaeota archaeon]